MVEWAIRDRRRIWSTVRGASLGAVNGAARGGGLARGDLRVAQGEVEVGAGVELVQLLLRHDALGAFDLALQRRDDKLLHERRHVRLHDIEQHLQRERRTDIGVPEQ